jgi:hypothetical protein
MQVSILYEIAHLTLFAFSPSLVVCCSTNLTRPSRLSRVEWWECDGLFPYAWVSFYGKSHGTAIYLWDCGRASVQTGETTTMGILFVRNQVIPNLRAGKPTTVCADFAKPIFEYYWNTIILDVKKRITYSNFN